MLGAFHDSSPYSYEGGSVPTSQRTSSGLRGDKPCSENDSCLLSVRRAVWAVWSHGWLWSHSWVRAPATIQNPCPPCLPPGAEGHLSVGPGSELLGTWSLGSGSTSAPDRLCHLCGPQPLPGLSLSYCKVRGGVTDPLIIGISDHKGRLREIQENVEPVSEFLAPLCPLVDFSCPAPRRK